VTSCSPCVVAARRPDAYVFPTRTGRRQYESKVRTATLAGAVKVANRKLERAGLTPLPQGLTPRTLSRTFCSLHYALSEDPDTVMDEMGHTDPALALRVYRQAMRRDEGEPAALRGLVEATHLAGIGRRTEIVPRIALAWSAM
jgi:integrase